MASKVLTPSARVEVERVLEEHNIAGRGICDRVTYEEIQSLVDHLPADERPNMMT
jgi:hypothetical protein